MWVQLKTLRSCLLSTMPPEILAQVQEVILPIITFTLEGKLLGKCVHHRQSTAVLIVL